MQHREYIKATTVYNFYTSRFDPDTIRAISFDHWKLLAAAAHKKGELAMAYESYQKALRVHPANVEILQQLVNLAILFNNYPSALKYNNALLKFIFNKESVNILISSNNLNKKMLTVCSLGLI